MQLFKNQERLVNGLAKKLFDGIRKVVGQQPTGGGKTVIFANISHRYIQRSDKNVLILVHRKELLKQTRKTLYNAFEIECHSIVAGTKYVPPCRVYVAMVETAYRRIEKIKNIGLVIIDEAHIASFNKVHEHYPDQYIIGFTATPLSSSKKRPMNIFYEDIVCGASIKELIEEGLLCQNITYAPKETVDRLELEKKGNDFDDHSMSIAFSKPKYIHNTVTAYEKYDKGAKAIVFNVGVDHSKEVAKAFTEAGYNCRHLDSNTSDVERDRILLWFKNTPGAILCNVGIATVGFDEPTIECVIVNKATMSMPLWLQMCGRGSRTSEGKKIFTIIDMGGNWAVHGDWNQDRDWQRIFFNPPKPGEEGVAPVKSCPKCEAIIHASISICPHCQYEYPPKEITVEQELSEFVQVTKNIDVLKIIEQNKDKKEYYAFFKIGKDLAEQAKNTVANMSDENANFILQKYDELARVWTKNHKKRYNKWHQELAKDHLFNELQNYFPKWQRAAQLVSTT